MDPALDHNPYQRPVMTTPPSISVLATTDASLGARTDMVVAGALSPAALNQIAWYGGVPTAKSSAYVAMPVTSVAKPDGTGSGGNAGLPDATLNQWASAFEIMTDAPVVEFCIYAHSGRKVMFQVDGAYVDKVGTAGAQASNADNFFKLTFATRIPRRIRVLLSNHPSNGPCYLKSLRMTATCSFWKPPQSEVLRVGWVGDSYSEGTNGAGTIYPIPNAAWPVLTCELLGLRDCRQLAVGSCGYLSDSSGTRSKLRDQIPRWVNQAPFDLIVFANGFNDASFTPYAITAEVLYDLQLASTMHPGVPIVVLGCQAGSAGPNAAQIATESAIAQAVAKFNYPLCKFAPVSTDTPSWLNGTGYVGATNGTGNSDVYIDPDHTHPTVAGAEFIAYRSAAAIRTAVLSMLD